MAAGMLCDRGIIESVKGETARVITRGLYIEEHPIATLSALRPIEWEKLPIDRVFILPHAAWGRMIRGWQHPDIEARHAYGFLLDYGLDTVTVGFKNPLYGYLSADSAYFVHNMVVAAAHAEPRTPVTVVPGDTVQHATRWARTTEVRFNLRKLPVWTFKVITSTREYDLGSTIRCTGSGEAYRYSDGVLKCAGKPDIAIHLTPDGITLVAILA